MEVGQHSSPPQDFFQPWAQYEPPTQGSLLFTPPMDVSPHAVTAMPFWSDPNTDADTNYLPQDSSIAAAQAGFQLRGKQASTYHGTLPHPFGNGPAMSSIYNQSGQPWAELPMRLPLRSKSGNKRVNKTINVAVQSAAAMNSKKRRRKTQMVAKRHSRMPSNPQNNIFDWQGMGLEDRLIQRWASSNDSARQMAQVRREDEESPSSTTSFHKFSVMNSMKDKLGDAGVEPMRLLDDPVDMAETKAVQPISTASWHQHPHVASQSAPEANPWRPQVTIDTSLSQGQQQTSPIQLLPESTRSSPSSPEQNMTMPSRHTSQVLPSNEPARRESSSSSASIDNARSIYDDFEEDGFAFLHPDDGSGYITDDPEEVYCDFGAAFQTAETNQAGKYDEQLHQDWFDGLGGPPWPVQC